jgi:hypothetical protein
MFRKVLGSRTPVNVQPEFKSLITAAKRRFCTQLLHWAARLLFRRRGGTHHATLRKNCNKKCCRARLCRDDGDGRLVPAKAFNVNGPGFHVWISAFTTLRPWRRTGQLERYLEQLSAELRRDEAASSAALLF